MVFDSKIEVAENDSNLQHATLFWHNNFSRSDGHFRGGWSSDLEEKFDSGKVEKRHSTPGESIDDVISWQQKRQKSENSSRSIPSIEPKRNRLINRLQAPFSHSPVGIHWGEGKAFRTFPDVFRIIWGRRNGWRGGGVQILGEGVCSLCSQCTRSLSLCFASSCCCCFVERIFVGFVFGAFFSLSV